MQPLARSNMAVNEDDSGQALCGPGTTNHLIIPSSDCDGFTFKLWNLLGTGNYASLVWEELNGTVHESAIDPLANDGIHSVNSSVWRNAAFMLQKMDASGNLVEVNRADITVDMQVCHTKNDPKPVVVPVCGPNNDQIQAEESVGISVDVKDWQNNQATVTYTSTDHKLFSNGSEVLTVTLTDSNEPCPSPTAQPTVEPTPTQPIVSSTPTVTETPAAPLPMEDPKPEASPVPPNQSVFIPLTGDASGGLFYAGLALFLLATGILAFRFSKRFED